MTARRRREPREQRGQLDAFTRAYIEAALWSSNDESDERGGDPLDANYGPDDISAATMRLITEDTADFQARFGALIQDDESPAIEKWGRWELAGHAFWLTRNGYGAGFGDGNFPKHDQELRKAAKLYGEFYLLVGDDGEIHGHRAHGGAAPTRAGEHRVEPPAGPILQIGSTVVLPAGWQVGMGRLRHDTTVTIDRIDTDSEGRPIYGFSWFDPTARHKNQTRHSWLSHDEALQLVMRGGFSHPRTHGGATPTRGNHPAGEGHRFGPEGWKSAMRVGDELMGALNLRGDKPAPIPGGYRWNDPNEAVQFTTYSPAYSQKVVVVVSVFKDGAATLGFFSDEGLSGTAQYENITHFNYDDTSRASVAEMANDVRWVWQTVDEYAASWQEDAPEVDEARRGHHEESRRGGRHAPRRHRRRVY